MPKLYKLTESTIKLENLDFLPDKALLQRHCTKVVALIGLLLRNEASVLPGKRESVRMQKRLTSEKP